MTTRRRNILVLVLVLAASAAGAYFLAPGMRDRAPIDAIPNGAFLVITLDLVKLRASPLARELADVREVSDVTQECGFDPLARARAIAIGVPEKPDGVFGLSITHDLGRDELAKCAERVMSARSATPHVTQRGSWTVVEQEGILSEATRAKIAYRDGAPLLVARGDYLATMQATLDGKKIASDHDALRKVAAAHAGENAILIATALLPKSVRDKLKDELASEADTTSESKKETMNGILAVSSVAISVASHADALDVFVELGCETADACATVNAFLERKRKSIAGEPAARLVGVAGILDAVHIDTHGTVIDASVTAPEAEFARAVRAILKAPGFSAPR